MAEKRSTKYLFDMKIINALQSALEEYDLIDKSKSFKEIFLQKNKDKINWKGSIQSLSYFFYRLVGLTSYKNQTIHELASQRFLIKDKSVTVSQLNKAFNHFQKKYMKMKSNEYPSKILTVFDAIEMANKSITRHKIYTE